MRTAMDIAAVRKRMQKWRTADERVALVPTMGNLHRGHLRLVEQATTLAPRTVVSIFVNPMQFDRPDDLAAYPRTLDRDLTRLGELEVDLVFVPDDTVLYPAGSDINTRVEVPELSEMLDGEHRPGHFAGVTTVVTKLFNIVQPDIAVFGEKDYQQLLLVRRLVADLNMTVEIVGAPTVREKDGLAMSSRNNYLDKKQRAIAAGLYETLQKLARKVEHGNRDYRELEKNAAERLSKLGFRPDYISIRRAKDLAAPNPKDKELVVLAAAFLGSARLIDNIKVSL
ncbi:MAG: pantoate--beta-alanine ligase [Gammaproteobacteria bacterium]